MQNALVLILVPSLVLGLALADAELSSPERPERSRVEKKTTTACSKSKSAWNGVTQYVFSGSAMSAGPDR